LAGPAPAAPATPTPVPQLRFTAPDSNAVFPAGSTVDLRWEWPLDLSETQQFRVAVQSDNEEFQGVDEVTNQQAWLLPDLPAGSYRCVVLVQEVAPGAQVKAVARSRQHRFSVTAPAGTPSPSAAPTSALNEEQPTTATAPAEMSMQPSPELLDPPPDDTAQVGTPKTFGWRWPGQALPDGWGFEVVVWKPGMDSDLDPPGAQDAIYTTANMRRLAGYEYRVDIDLAGAKSCEQNGAGDYLWSVRLVHLPPNYAYIRSWPPGRRIVVASPGTGDDRDRSCLGC